jgi:hypothetical protein
MMTGRLDAAPAQLLQHVEAVQAREHDIEQHEVERLGRRALEPALPVGARLDVIALARPAGR